MRDQLFTATDVEQALRQAEALLGVPRHELRYVVLDAGEPGRYGGPGRPARVAVMLEPRAAAAAGRPERGNETASVAPGVEDVLRVIREEAELQLEVSVRDAEGSLEIEVNGPDEAFLTTSPVAEALQHLLQRAASRAAGAPKRVFFGGVGARRRREEELGRLAAELAERVRREGRPQIAPAMNAYERRVVHMRLADEPGVSSRSEGEGRSRRLVVEPRFDPAPPGGSPGPA